jgi:DNA-binding transcriptional MerR regulator
MMANRYSQFLANTIDSDSVTVYNQIVQEHEQRYTIEELTELVALPVRTIRYYITEGLLPGPGTRGKSAAYNEEHLLKLRLIRRLTEQHMPLAEIQALLSRLSLAEIRASLEEQEQRVVELEQSMQQGASAKTYIETLLKNAQAARRSTSTGAPSSSAQAPPQGEMPRFPPEVPPFPSKSYPDSIPDYSPVPVGESWHRWTLADGVELHIRSDAEYRQRDLIERLFRALGMIFQHSKR